MRFIKGQVPLVGIVIGGLASVVTAFISGSFGASQQLAEAKTAIAVVSEREDNHYKEVQKQLESIDKKLDGVLNSLRNNPNY